jgi:hypothetical protein
MAAIRIRAMPPRRSRSRIPASAVSLGAYALRTPPAFRFDMRLDKLHGAIPTARPFRDKTKTVPLPGLGAEREIAALTGKIGRRISLFQVRAAANRSERR